MLPPYKGTLDISTICGKCVRYVMSLPSYIKASGYMNVIYMIRFIFYLIRLNNNVNRRSRLFKGVAC